ncbi:MAG TPA: EamA family transporter [Gemmatimonadales bacterium]|nr:EamA family transporter [Gemmatimonadales bacterium]
MSRRVAAAFAVVYVVWGSTYLAIRYAVATLPPFLLAGSRYLLAGALLYGWARWRGAPRPDRRAWLPAVGLGVLFIPLGNGLLVWAEERVPSSLAALIAAGIPLWVALFERLTPGGSRLGASRTIGLLLGFMGVALLVGGNPLQPGPAPAGRSLAVAAASVTSALGIVLLRRARLPGGPAMTSAMPMLAGGAMALLVAAGTGEVPALDLARVSVSSAAAWAYLVLFGSILGFTCFAWLVTHVAPSRAATHAYVNPVVALGLGAWLGGETVGWRALAATPVILLGLLLVLREGPRSDRGGEQVAWPRGPRQRILRSDTVCRPDAPSAARAPTG